MIIIDFFWGCLHMFLKKLTIVFTLIILICCTIVIFFPENTFAVEKVDIIRLEGGDWGYPTPYAHYPRGPGGFKMCLIFDSLLERDEDGLIPWLAKDYEIKNEGRQYLFTLREDVYWHDGQPLTAEDVKFSFTYAVKHPMVWSYINKQDIKEIAINGKYQVIINVENPDAALLYNLGRTRIIPKHIWERVEKPEQFTGREAVIGTGPYQLTDYSKEHGTYRFRAFADFWGQEQAVEVIEFIPLSQKVLAFEKNRIDLIQISPDLLGRYSDNNEFEVIQRPAFWGYRLLFNMKENKLLQNKNIRRAFSYAINSQELIEKIARGAGVQGSAGILPPDHIYYNPGIKKYAINLEKAKELFAADGYYKINNKGILINQNGKKLSFNLQVTSDSIRLAELLREMLARVGVEIKIISADRKTHDSRVLNYKYELAILGHGGWGGEADYLTRFIGDSTINKKGISPLEISLAGYNSEKLNTLLIKQKKEFDKNKRKEVIYEIQEVVAAEVPEIPLFYTSGYTVYRPEKYSGWMFMYDHHCLTHGKLSYLLRKD